MVVDTYVDKARARIRSEQEAIGEMLDANEAFIQRIQTLETE